MHSRRGGHRRLREDEQEDVEDDYGPRRRTHDWADARRRARVIDDDDGDDDDAPPYFRSRSRFAPLPPPPAARRAAWSQYDPYAPRAARRASPPPSRPPPPPPRDVDRGPSLDVDTRQFHHRTFVDLRRSVATAYAALAAGNTGDAEDQLAALLRCPACEVTIDSGAGTRIAACGHVYHKDPEPCWRDTVAAGAPGEPVACKACNRNVFYRQSAGL